MDEFINNKLEDFDRALYVLKHVEELDEQTQFYIFMVLDAFIKDMLSVYNVKFRGQEEATVIAAEFIKQFMDDAGNKKDI